MRSTVLGGVGALAVFGAAAELAPVAAAAECGAGTVYDPPSDTCVVAPAAPAPADWNAPPPPPMPPLPPLSICPPIPFVPVCFPLN